MTTSRVETAAALLDAHLILRVISTIALSLEIYTTDVVGLDAVNGLIGYKKAIVRRADGRSLWRCQDEDDNKRLLEACLPHMKERGALAEAGLNFLAATTPGELFKAIREIEEERQWIKQRAGL